MALIFGELPGFTYPRMYYPEKKIDRSGKKLGEYLAEQGVVWGPDLDKADIWIRKAELSFESPRSEADEIARIQKCRLRPTLLLIHETQENTPIAHRLADPKMTY